MKQITIVGNIGANATRRTTADGKELMSFNVAVNQSDNKAIWFNCLGNLREKLLPYLVKGQCVCVHGDLIAGTYNGNLDMGIYIDRIELCGTAPVKDEEAQQ